MTEFGERSLAVMRLANDRTEVTLPDAKIDHRSQPGPFEPVVMQRLWLEIHGTGHSV
jgi:hypothetical protein